QTQRKTDRRRHQVVQPREPDQAAVGAEIDGQCERRCAEVADAFVREPAQAAHLPTRIRIELTMLPFSWVLVCTAFAFAGNACTIAGLRPIAPSASPAAKKAYRTSNGRAGKRKRSIWS